MQEKPSVLIVDDERADLTGLERDLAPLGFRLLTLQDGHQLLDRVRAERPDLVLLDALLPGLSGFDLCKQIKTSAEGKNTLVVILTGVYVKDQYRQDAMRQFKADGFVTKPYRAPELHRLVLRLMSKKLRTTPAELRQMLREMSKAIPPGDDSPLAPAEEKKGWLSRLFGRARPAEPLSLESIAPVAPPPTPRVQVVEEAAPVATPTEVEHTERTAIQLGPGEPVMQAMPGMAEPPPPSSPEEPPPAALPAEEPTPAAESPGSLESPEPDAAGP
ncbi:MAG: response regulator, partial [Acidobacteria bacterium]|nr:response regulator [Acidobacteriota bacterium]